MKHKWRFFNGQIIRRCCRYATDYEDYVFGDDHDHHRCYLLHRHYLYRTHQYDGPCRGCYGRGILILTVDKTSQFLPKWVKAMLLMPWLLALTAHISIWQGKSIYLYVLLQNVIMQKVQSWRYVSSRIRMTCYTSWLFKSIVETSGISFNKPTKHLMFTEIFPLQPVTWTTETDISVA